jgi:hypothetical protein
VAAFKNRKLQIPENEDEMHEIQEKGDNNEILKRTDQFRYIETYLNFEFLGCVWFERKKDRIEKNTKSVQIHLLIPVFFSLLSYFLSNQTHH